MEDSKSVGSDKPMLEFKVVKDKVVNVKAVLVVTLSIVAVVVSVAVGAYFWRFGYGTAGDPPPAPPQKVDEVVTSYDECILSEGAVIQESYPETCVTKGGKSFVNTKVEVLIEEDLSEDAQEDGEDVAVEIDLGKVDTSEWLTYEYVPLGLRFKYPSGFTIAEEEYYNFEDGMQEYVGLKVTSHLTDEFEDKVDEYVYVMFGELADKKTYDSTDINDLSVGSRFDDDEPMYSALNVKGVDTPFYYFKLGEGGSIYDDKGNVIGGSVWIEGVRIGKIKTDRDVYVHLYEFYASETEHDVQEYTKTDPMELQKARALIESIEII